MEKNLAVVVCNYNKKEYVIKNIKSLRCQDIDCFDIYVVDNASTDGSVSAIRDAYGDEVNLICNEENLGGTGGFNTGIRGVMQKGYSYIVLLDNDVVLKEDALRTLYKDMEDNPDIGIMGAKILKMDYPDIIQEFAPTVNYSTMTFELNHGGEKDNGSLPHLADCDYVPACALIVRQEVIEKIGVMPEDNYIYYDDIEWGIRCHRAGYRVVANSHASVWHKGGAMINPSTFGTYYLNRNKLKLFMTYSQTEPTKAEKSCLIDERIDHILRDIYEGLYSCEYRGMNNVAKTRMDAFLDAINGISGVADAYKIRQREIINEKFDRTVKSSGSVRIYMNGLWENSRRILNHIQLLEKESGHPIAVELTDDELYKNDSCLGVSIRGEKDASDSDFDLVFYVCDHIYKLDIDSFDRKWVDGWRNTIFDTEDYNSYKNYEPSYRVFKLCFEDRVREAMNRQKGDYVHE